MDLEEDLEENFPVAEVLEAADCTASLVRRPQEELPLPDLIFTPLAVLRASEEQEGYRRSTGRLSASARKRRAFGCSPFSFGGGRGGGIATPSLEPLHALTLSSIWQSSPHPISRTPTLILMMCTKSVKY